MKTLFLLATLFLPSPTEHLVGHNVQFMVTKDHKLQPVLPVSFVVNQEQGPLADGLLTCDLVDREVPGGHAIVFKCNGDRVFVVDRTSFTASDSRGVK